MESHLAIQTEGVSKIYRQKIGKSVLAHKDLSLSLPRGEVFGLLGLQITG